MGPKHLPRQRAKTRKLPDRTPCLGAATETASPRYKPELWCSDLCSTSAQSATGGAADHQPVGGSLDAHAGRLWLPVTHLGALKFAGPPRQAAPPGCDGCATATSWPDW